MNCEHSPEIVAAWLDGEIDLGPHALECRECQQQLAQLQKLRSRLQPPPSPLGADFARRTAARVMRDSLLQCNVETQRQLLRSSWWERLRDNALVHVLTRERGRRLFALPSLAAVLAAYLLPGLLVRQQGMEDAHWAFFGTLKLGLVLLLPLYLLAIEYATLSSLVRGRCLEEILHAGMQPPQICDTVACNGVRSLLPTTLLIAVPLTLLQPSPALFSWLLLTWCAFVATSYISQAQLFAPRWRRSWTLLHLLAAAGALAAPAPCNWLFAPLLAASGWLARSQAIQGLVLTQNGQVPASWRRPRNGWQQALSRRLPDDALLQRELLREPSLPFTPWVLAASLGLASVSSAWPELAPAPLLAGVILSALSAWVSARLVAREKESGTYEVLVHSGLRGPDWLRAAFRLALLRFWPLLLTFSLTSNASTGGEAWLFPATLGWLCALIVAIWVGACSGAAGALRATTSRATFAQPFKEWLLAGAYGAVFSVFGNLLVGRSSPVLLMVTDLSQSRTIQTAALLLLSLIGAWWRTRVLEKQLLSEQRSAMRVGLSGTQWLVPVALAYQFAGRDLTLGQAGHWFGLVAALWTAVLCGWWAPLQPRLFGDLRSRHQRFALLGIAVGTALLTVALTYWSSWALVLFEWAPGIATWLREWHSTVDVAQLGAIFVSWSALWLLLGLRQGWQPAPYTRAGWVWPALSLVLVGAAAAVLPLWYQVREVRRLGAIPLPTEAARPIQDRFNVRLRSVFPRWGFGQTQQPSFWRSYSPAKVPDSLSFQEAICSVLQRNPEMIREIRQQLATSSELSLSTLQFSSALLRQHLKEQVEARNPGEVLADLQALRRLARRFNQATQGEERREGAFQYLGLLLSATVRGVLPASSFPELREGAEEMVSIATQERTELEALQHFGRFSGFARFRPEHWSGTLVRDYMCAEFQRMLACKPHRAEQMHNPGAYPGAPPHLRSLYQSLAHVTRQRQSALLLQGALELAMHRELQRQGQGRLLASWPQPAPHLQLLSARPGYPLSLRTREKMHSRLQLHRDGSYRIGSYIDRL